MEALPAPSGPAADPADNTEPATIPARPEVWLIEVPKHGFAWFTRDHERVLFWEGRADAIVTAYARWLP